MAPWNGPNHHQTWYIGYTLWQWHAGSRRALTVRSKGQRSQVMKCAADVDMHVDMTA